MTRKTLVFDISSHGLGHLALSGPIIERLHHLYPFLDMVLRSRYPRNVISRFVNARFETLPPPFEVAMVAPSAMTIDLDASAKAYRELHEDWQGLVKKRSQYDRWTSSFSGNLKRKLFDACGSSTCWRAKSCLLLRELARCLPVLSFRSA
jgi:hypothetical protein